MNCPECQDLLQQRMDGEATPTSDALERHLSECSACRELHSGATILLEGLKKMPLPRLAPDFARTMTAEILHDRRQRRAKMGRRILVTVAMAASVVLLLLLAYRWIPGAQKPHAPNPIPNPMAHKPEPAPSPPKQETPPPEPKPAPSNAFTKLTDRLADTTRDHAKVVLVGTNLDAVEKLPVNELPMLDPSVREAGQEVSDGVLTVTRTTRQAFNFFSRELPMPDMGEQKH
ncbi:MAG TPA: zf-HC2 domain-containing protein [Gemmataceae bacterium]|nr:zf-HC2 domain-containing protein [Gemmataceae bacterium]